MNIKTSIIAIHSDKFHIMEVKSRDILADNMARLMEAKGWKETYVAKKGQWTSASTINKILNPEKEGPNYSPTLNNIERIASVFGLQAWQMLIENLPVEILDDPSALQNIKEATDILDSIDLTALGTAVTKLNNYIEKHRIELSEDKYKSLMDMAYQDEVAGTLTDDRVVRLVRLAA